MQTPLSISLENVKVFVFHDNLDDRYRAGRTVRALRKMGVVAEAICGHNHTLSLNGPAWLIRAGSWPAHPDRIHFPPAAHSGRPLCALGLPHVEQGATAGSDISRWHELHKKNGGDFSKEALPTFFSAYLESLLVSEFSKRCLAGESFDGALRHVSQLRDVRVIRHRPLDIYFDNSLRVAQLITSLQIGGAERVALDLFEELPNQGIKPLLITLGTSVRTSFKIPAKLIDVSAVGNRAKRIQAAGNAALSVNADLIHCHLLTGEDSELLAACGLPLLHTVHNARRGWPAGLENILTHHAALLVACSRATESDLREARIPVPCRTVWNGVDFGAFERTDALIKSAHEFRKELGIMPGDFVWVTLANPRPQKRLHLLPETLRAAQTELSRQGINRSIHLVIAGEASHNDAAREAEAQLHAEIKKWHLTDRVHLIGASMKIATILASSDVFVSTSAYEGLSLAQIEALASGLPLVTVDSGGTRELARGNPAVTLLPLDFAAVDFARAAIQVMLKPPDSGHAVAQLNFTRSKMTEGYCRLYPRAIEAARGLRKGNGLWLICNNFSTGGAQSSARRLLLGLHEKGIRVRAAVLEEQAEFPTPGRRALTAAGIEVLALPIPSTADPAQAVATLLCHIDNDPPEALVFWNAIAEHKILIVDSILDIPIFDVSPGEMFFESLEKYFQRPRPGLPYFSISDYGARLAGAVVKYHREAERAANSLQTRIHVIPNGVPMGRVPQARNPDGLVVIGTAARISPQKKLEQLIEAMHAAKRRLPAYVLRIAGGVERGCEMYFEHLQALSAGVNVEWCGELPDVREFLSTLDIFAMISEPAGCPNASLEAMAAALPIIATDVGGSAEQIDDGVTGRLVERSDTGAFAEALIELSNNPEHRQKFGKAARRRAEDRFDVNRMIADYVRVIFNGPR